MIFCLLLRSPVTMVTDFISQEGGLTTKTPYIILLWFWREIVTVCQYSCSIWYCDFMAHSTTFLRSLLLILSSITIFVSYQEQIPAGCIKTSTLVRVSLSFSFSSISDKISCSTWGFESNQKMKIIVWDTCGWVLGKAIVLTAWLSGSRSQRVLILQ